MNSHGDKNQENDQFIIIKKKVAIDDTPNNLGSWKIVYADFMTVLMAFFLVMWIINATDDDTKKAIEQYFNPFGKNLMTASKGIFDEQNPPERSSQNKIDLSIDEHITKNSVDLKIGSTNQKKQYQRLENNIFYLSNSQQSEHCKNSLTRDSEKGKDLCKSTDLEKSINKEENYFLPPLSKEKILAMKRKKRLQDLAKKISSTLSGLVADNIVKGVLFETTRTGILISIIDQRNTPMFDKSSSIPLPETIVVLQKIGEVLAHSTEVISIRGHTDASPFRNIARDNWRLSLDRAYSAYQVLMKSGVSEDRISKISGFAHHRLKIASDPMNSANRRIDILVEDRQG
ncbi:flagellar motor protein MotB [Candidatus Liberibacter asiaticus]|uniref:Flagellar motor protein MotB n=3 Tax=Liberibacter asiaticus TaxID=34021 RepID=C6XF50_LIBAP|nr:flagellar motor protein MotB [Candidatus Liberibacter asiaticus]ACT57002.1 flagellar motor protein MotB [Candidatus Liberibacter asiaticus str. psy62]AGH17032.1 flagellar motor protein MotB [Candidatus Liberibacter asiaticus str. gxpsy]ALK07360.1 OmpA family protein [Candidatus Liberibacter asiaticus]ASK52852.1 flagellar motor protein MotB [Candidatus Liberibacter asiaticus]AWL14169.1 flagellar motor protein MotB [Candidatus Liberibacter asiaticus]